MMMDEITIVMIVIIVYITLMTSKNSKVILWLNICSVIVLLLFNLSSMRVTMV